MSGHPDVPREQRGDQVAEKAPIRFADLVDVAGLHALMDSLYRVFGLANAIIDVDGTIITQSGWQDLCTQFHRVHPATCRRCIESDTSLAASMTQGEKFAIYLCLNGLTDTAAPIVVAGQHVANLFTGQFFTAPPSLDFFIAQAAEFGFPLADYLAAVGRVPVVDMVRVRGIVAMYAQLATLLAQAGYDRWRQQQAEAQLQHARRHLEERSCELEAANRELEEFSYSISHDLRTPLRAMAGFSEILLAEHGDELQGESRRLLDAISGNAGRLARLMDGVQEFISLGRRPLRPRAIDMNRLVAEAFAALRAQYPQRPLELISQPLPAAFGDPALIRRVLDNLLSNAVRFTSERQPAIVRVHGRAATEDDAWACTPAGIPAAEMPFPLPIGKRNVYDVIDNGVGFDMRYVDRLFRVFERAHTPQEDAGAGVGLAIVRRIVMRHGGAVHAEGQIGSGACFSFSLPAVE